MYKIFLICLFLTRLALGQVVDDIKSKSKNTTNSNSTTKTSTSSNTSSTSSSSDKSNGFFSNIFSSVFISIFKGIGYLQKETLSKKFEQPRIFSLDAFVIAGYNPLSNYYLIQPRIRGTWGIFGTDFRFYQIIEPRLNYTDNIKYYDWQFLQLNILNIKPVNIRIGTGLTFESFKDSIDYLNIFSENTLGVDVYLMQDKLKLSTEGRLIYSESRKMSIRKELSLNVAYKIYGKEQGFHFYANIGGTFNQFYNSVNVWTANTGLSFRLD